MNFSGKPHIVREVQKIINVTRDGVPGSQTWRAIANRLNVSFSTDLRTTIRNVQRALIITSDGIDGPQTWNAIHKKLNENKQDDIQSSPLIQTHNYPERVLLSPQTNGSNSQRIIPSALVLHHTSGSYIGSIDWTSRIIDPRTGKRLYASYHVIIARDGRRTVTNMDDNRAYHAGPSSLNGRSNLNSWSLGIAWEGDTYKTPLSDSAMDSAIEFIIPRLKRWNISLNNVVDHRIVSPGRKTDIAVQEYNKFMSRLKSKL
jgi:hypothetical protein